MEIMELEVGLFLARVLLVVLCACEAGRRIDRGGFGNNMIGWLAMAVIVFTVLTLFSFDYLVVIAHGLIGLVIIVGLLTRAIRRCLVCLKRR